MNWDPLHIFISSLDPIDYAALSINILLILFARPILERFSSGTLPLNVMSLRINLLRGLNVIIVLVYGYQYLYLPAGGSARSDNYSLTTISILAILYLAYLSNFIVQYAIHKHYGKARSFGDKTIFIPTYQSRLLSILATILLTVIAIISIVKQLGFDSVLEAGGVLGFIGVLFGLTQASWAPDIISGLIILNSDMFEEGDIVETDDNILGRVHKTKMFHTEIVNMTNNHRIMIRNEFLRNKIIHNLSKYSSGKGLRECLSFNIGYEADPNNIKEMLINAYNDALGRGTPAESNPEPEIKVLETGDYAVKWGLLYHIKQIENIVSIRRDLTETILEYSKKYDITLATPILVDKQSSIEHHP